MRKINLLLLGMIFALMVIPTVFATENTITNPEGNDSSLEFALRTVQITANPGIGDNVTYVTFVNVTSITGEAGTTWNLTSFRFYPPDNLSSSVVTDFVLRNTTGDDQANASHYVTGDYNYANFTDFDGESALLNNSVNGTEFNITWVLLHPIGSTKLVATRNGNTYTETWNITSSATNLTIVNASLNVTPTYWHTRIGNPTVTFNSTSKGYSASLADLLVYTDLNLSNGVGDGNLLVYGSGWQTLSVVYNGPEVSSSSGDNPSKPLSIIPGDISRRTIILVSLLGLLVIAVVSLSVVFLKKK